jgi:hypothetical protein
MYVFITTKLVNGINYVGPLSPIHPLFTQGLQPMSGYVRNGRFDFAYAQRINLEDSWTVTVGGDGEE